MKRVFDVVVALIALIALSPLLILTALVVVSTSRGGVFFRQDRVGRGGATFRIFKFRSMVAGADRVGPYSTAPGDARITRVGHVLRRTSIDELPQLLNVIMGHMSLVGPRPDVPAQRELYSEDEWRSRHAVRPGITGLAQATLRSAATMEQRKALDLDYASRPSLWFDLRIMAMTIKQVLFKGGNH